MPFFGVPIRNGLPIGLGSSAGFGIAPFEPYSLFENGEQGAWYDPNDFSTLFTDSAGTTPVTGVEQFVGLMLDKSKGLVLGPELVTNGGFDSDTGWSKFGSPAPTISGGVASWSGSTSSFSLVQSMGLQTGKTYRVTFTVISRTVGEVSVKVNGGGALSQSPNVSVPGTYTYLLSSTAADGQLAFGVAVGFAGTIDNVSVRELPGNHAFQTSSAKRPKLAARYNLLTYSEEFDQGVWTKTNITAANTTATTDPLGGLTADLITQTAASGQILQSVSATTVADTYTFSVYLKYTNTQWIRPVISNLVVAGQFWFDVQNGLLGTYSMDAGVTYVSHSITSVGNGWYLCSGTLTLPASASAFSVFFNTAASDGSATRVTGTFYAWGADLRPASQATGLIGPTYQRVAAATVYDTAGFLPYLAFDGLSWSMSTNSIDPGAIDKAQVFAGVRKLSDALSTVLVELSANASLNAGTFNIFAPVTGGNGEYRYLAGGSTSRNVLTSLYAAPITNILTGTNDISGDTLGFRVNAVSVGTSALDQGTGNFGNYPLFIGARNNASLFFNGWLSSLIVRFGANLAQSQIDLTESYVNQKTGAF